MKRGHCCFWAWKHTEQQINVFHLWKASSSPFRGRVIPTSSKLPKAASRSPANPPTEAPEGHQTPPPRPPAEPPPTTLQTGHLRTHAAVTKPSQDGWLGSWSTVSDEVELQHHSPTPSPGHPTVTLRTPWKNYRVGSQNWIYKEVEPKTKTSFPALKDKLATRCSY